MRDNRNCVKLNFLCSSTAALSANQACEEGLKCASIEPDEREATPTVSSWETLKGAEKCVYMSECQQNYKVDGVVTKVAGK